MLPQEFRLHTGSIPHRLLKVFALEAYAPQLLQLCAFVFGLFVNRNVGVGRLPESVAGADALQNVTDADSDAARVGALAAYNGFLTETRQPNCPAVPHDAAVVEDLPELGRRRKRSEERV